MAELRYNPLIGDWVMIASHRQNRPQMPKDWCPFCPGEGKNVQDYDVLEYDNDFPALMLEPPMPDDVARGELFKTAPAAGKCEVILYSPKHTITLPELPLTHITKLVRLWQERFTALSREEKIKYVFLFENRGDVVGVTMPHPHGQIYGYSWVPLRVKRKLENSAAYFTKNGRCIYCDILKEEMADGRRIVFENSHFVGYLPFWTDYPYGISLQPKQHITNINDFTEDQTKSFAEALKYASGTLDALYNKPFPYMMCLYNAPVDGGDHGKHWHFHIEFFPPMRSDTKQKFNASSETGAWAACNPTAPEEKAAELREAYARFVKNAK
ncbi:MAG: galactose-1-phosphate uridylyltransferase [Spirochaetes bacterium]|nr:galactose-1-phosphate uridylyltransferase [Spirochaetota bacterium]